MKKYQGAFMHFKKIILSSLLLGSSLYAKNSLGLNINNNDLEIRAAIDLNGLADYSNGTTYLLDLDYLHVGDPSANMTMVGFSGQNTLQGLQGFTLAFGMKSILASDFAALSFTGKAIYTLPISSDIPKTDLIFNAAYAPAVLSFRDGDQYTEFRVETDMEIIPNVHMFAGYRNIELGYEVNHISFDAEFSESFYGGMRLTF